MFRVGQKIVCVDADGAPMLTLNGTYTVRHVSEIRRVRWRGQIYYLPSVFLYESSPVEGYWGFSPLRFRPVDDRKTDIAVFTKMLKPKKTSVDA